MLPITDPKARRQSVKKERDELNKILKTGPNNNVSIYIFYLLYQLQTYGQSLPLLFIHSMYKIGQHQIAEKFF